MHLLHTLKHAQRLKHTSWPSGLRVMAMTSPIVILFRRIYPAAYRVTHVSKTPMRSCNACRGHVQHECKPAGAMHAQHALSCSSIPVFSITYTLLFSPPFGQDFITKVHSLSLMSETTCTCMLSQNIAALSKVKSIQVE